MGFGKQGKKARLYRQVFSSTKYHMVREYTISGEQGNTGLKWGGEQRPFWGTGNIGNQDFDFGEQGTKTIYFRGTRKHVPPLGGSHL